MRIRLWIEKYFAEDEVYTDKLISLVYRINLRKVKTATVKTHGKGK